MKKNKNIRTCLYSNKQYEKNCLVRLVKKDGQLIVDQKQNLLGRGYWLKLSEQALNDPKLITILSKRTKSSVNQDLINQLRKIY